MKFTLRIRKSKIDEDIELRALLFDDLNHPNLTTINFMSRTFR